MRASFAPSNAGRRMLAVVVAATCHAAAAQDAPRASLPPVSVVGSASDPVEKSYRRMVAGMDLFERLRPATAPQAVLRFRLLPRRPHTDMERIVLEIVGTTFSERIAVAADHTFVLPRDARALREDAVVSPNRQRLSMTWRTDIRTPGLPPNTRRLGDLRLECRVGLEAGLVSNNGPIARIAELFTDFDRYCSRKDARYLYFAERPLFSVTLVSGTRREVLPLDELYASASDDPGLAADLPTCDCEVLVSRTYFLPLGDPSWPDDTRVEFEGMDDAP